MSDHLIRLRAGWIGDFETGSTGIDLPTAWLAFRPARKFKLHRSFRLPRIKPEDSLDLVLDHVLGLASVALDEDDRSEAVTGPGPFSIPINAGPPRRVRLTLEIDPALWPTEFNDTDLPWGLVALRIRTK